jgi:hypothetical protein
MIATGASVSRRFTTLFVVGVTSFAAFVGQAAAQHEEHDVVAPPGAPETYPSLHIRGFSDFDYTSSDAPGRDVGFQLGQFVLHFVSPLAKKVTYYGEVSATPRTTEFQIEVERSFVRYDYNDGFKVSFGRFHTPIGYWNTAYHHGLWLQTTVRRPEQIAFGGTFVPVHFVGLLAEGKVPSGPIGLGYGAGVGNGRSEILSRAGDAGDPNTNRAWIAQVMARPSYPYGLEVGTSLYRDRLSLVGGPEIGEWILSGHAVWTGESPELLAEIIAVRHEDQQTGTDHDSQAFYVQAAYRLPGKARPVKPYARYEKIDVASGEPVFAMPDLQVVTAGIRLDLVELAAFKTEYRNELAEGSERVNALLFQTSFTF